MRRANSPPKFRWPIIACRKHRFHPLKSGFFKSTGQQVNGSASCFGDFESSKFRVSVDKNRSPSAKKQNPVGTWYFTSAHNFNTILNINHLARTRSIASLPWKIVLGDSMWVVGWKKVGRKRGGALPSYLRIYLRLSSSFFLWSGFLFFSVFFLFVGFWHFELVARVEHVGILQLWISLA